MYNEGYIAKYKEINIYMLSEETYEKMDSKKNGIIYAVRRNNRSEASIILVYADRIIGYMDGRTKHLVFWNFEMNGNFDGAGDFENLHDREIAYINARDNTIFLDLGKMKFSSEEELGGNGGALIIEDLPEE